MGAVILTILKIIGIDVNVKKKNLRLRLNRCRKSMLSLRKEKENDRS